MVFSSIQAYLDSSNWQQALPNNYNQEGAAGASATLGHVFRPQIQPQQQLQSNGSGGGGSGTIRAGSMVDRARQANVALPEAALKCPRCESTNTKFCYFNNYSLTQPRHFCKTCRRYWTRGGALRNVPVGGGCRRNRRTKSSSSNNNNNSTATSNNTSFSSGNASTISTILSSHYGGNQESILSQILSPGRLMNSAYNHLGDLTNNTKTDNNNNMSLLNYGGLTQDMRSIQMGTSGGSLMSCVDEWRSTSYPQQQSLGGGNLEDSSNPNPSSNGFYPFESPRMTSALASQFSSVKVEDNPYKWVNVNGNCSSWTDLSAFGSSR